MSTLDEQVDQAVVNDARSRRLADSILEMRRRAESLAAAHRERLQHAQASLGEHRRQLHAQLAQRDEAHDQQDRDLHERLARVEEREKKLRTQSEAIAEQCMLLQQLKQEHAANHSQWEDVQARGAQQQDALFAEIQQRLDRFEDERRKLDEQAADLVERRENLATQETAAGQHDSELQSLQQQLEHQRQQLEARESELRKREAALQELADRLQEWESRQAEPLPDHAEVDDLRGRLELALEEIRELKSAKKTLQRQVEEVPSAVATTATDPGNLDWESQKQRLLEQLESDFGDDAPEKLKIADILKQTDELLVERQREIDELQQLLEEQSGNIGGMAVGAAAIAGMLDSDELIQQERETLQAMQEEWRTKLRIAEVDISMERAKLARERTQMEERIQELERRMAQSDLAEVTSGKSSKSNRGRWLERLGLKDHD